MARTPVSLLVPPDYVYNAFRNTVAWPTSEGLGRLRSGRSATVSLIAPQGPTWPPRFPADTSRWCMFTSHGRPAVLYHGGVSNIPSQRFYSSRWWLTPGLWIEVMGEAGDPVGYLEVLTILRHARIGRARQPPHSWRVGKS